MDHNLDTACRIISEADRAHPADIVLKETFKRLRVLNAEERGEITRMVFAYFRWRGWIGDDKDLARGVKQSLELAERFRQSASIPAAELRAKAIPGWLAAEVDGADEWYQTLQQEPNLWLRAKRGQGKALAKKLGRAKSGALPDSVLYEGDEDLFRTPEFHAGEFELQDISSQAVGFICNPQPGETWWDACAGEGGKLLHLSSLMENKGLIWASDRAEWRLKHLKRRTARAQVFNYRAALWDGGKKLPTKSKFHGVLIDAPCSGVGTWQRNPQARWTTTLADVRELAAVQKQLLANAAPAVKPGGKLIYAVCTMTKSETIEVAEAFEQQFADFNQFPVTNPLKPADEASPRIWIWPRDSGGNGMFVAVWKRE